MNAVYKALSWAVCSAILVGGAFVIELLWNKWKNRKGGK